MLPSMQALALLALASSTAAAAAAAAATGENRTYFRGAGQVGAEDVRAALAAEMGGETPKFREMVDGLSRMYGALPKDADGNLGHQAVRYALHRFFVHRHGWYIKGLEPNNATLAAAVGGNKTSWVPARLQELLEERLGDRGASLRDIAALAAALEDLIRKESDGRLAAAFKAEGLTVSQMLSHDRALEVLDTYFISFLLAGNFTVGGKYELAYKKNIFAQKYKGFKSVNTWLHDRADKILKATGGNQFADLLEVANEIGGSYHTFNDVECSSLRTTLRGMEGRKPGRVRLSTFYNMSFYSHWRFTEKAQYLKQLGALDDSDPERPMVIVPNYVMGRSNCLEASNIYAICCRNECEELQGHLEKTIGAPWEEPSRIAAVLSELPEGQRPKLSEALLRRLEGVAEQHGGKVPLHGRLFAQWMHHAFPMECPFPHELGTTYPLTADEWVKETGHGDVRASEEDMRRHVENDQCTVEDMQKEDGPCGSPDLPWIQVEELLTHTPFRSLAAQASSETPAEASNFWAGLALWLAGAALATAAALLRSRAVQTGVALVLLLMVGWSLDIMDARLFGCELAAGLALAAGLRFLSSHAAVRFAKAACNPVAQEAKCYV